MLPIPQTQKQLPDNFALQAIVKAASVYPSLVPDLNKPSKWSAFKAHIGERCDALKITSAYIRLYEDDRYPMNLFFQFSFMKTVQRWIEREAKRAGYGDILDQSTGSVAPERMGSFIQSFVGPISEAMLDDYDLELGDDIDEAEREAKRYWQEVHPTLPLIKQQRTERDIGIYACLLFYAMHNAISVMAYGQTLGSLVRRAIYSESREDRDKAMCRAVRVDNNLRQHPIVQERYLQATRSGDADFLHSYNNTTSPLAGGVRFRGLYFLMAMLDCYGFLDRLSNPRLLTLCDYAKLDRWGNRIEDEGSLAKRRAEYQRHKFLRMSRH